MNDRMAKADRTLRRALSPTELRTLRVALLLLVSTPGDDASLVRVRELLCVDELLPDPAIRALEQELEAAIAVSVVREPRRPSADSSGRSPHDATN